MMEALNEPCELKMHCTRIVCEFGYSINGIHGHSSNVDFETNKRLGVILQIKFGDRKSVV